MEFSGKRHEEEEDGIIKGIEKHIKEDEEEEEVVEEFETIIEGREAAKEKTTNKEIEAMKKEENTTKAKEETIKEEEITTKEKEETIKEEEITTKGKEEIIKEEEVTTKEKEETIKEEEKTIKETEETIKEKEEIIKDSESSCDPCQHENVTTKANGICQECEEFICKTCFRDHLKVKQCRNHTFVKATSQIALKSVIESPEKCRNHYNEAVKFYCRKHEAVGCGDCIILGHRTCKTEYIQDLSKDFEKSEELSSLKTKLDQLETSFKEVDENVKNNRIKFKEMQEEVLGEIRKFRIDMNTHLDKAETDIISEGNQMMLDHVNLLDKLEQDCKDLSHNIEDIKQKLNAQENALFIQFVGCKKRLAELELTIANIRSRNKVKTFQFVPDRQLRLKVISTKKLGSWRDLTNKADEMDTQFRQPATGLAKHGINFEREQLRRWELLKDPVRRPRSRSPHSYRY